MSRHLHNLSSLRPQGSWWKCQPLAHRFEDILGLGCWGCRNRLALNPPTNPVAVIQGIWLLMLRQPLLYNRPRFLQCYCLLFLTTSSDRRTSQRECIPRCWSTIVCVVGPIQQPTVLSATNIPQDSMYTLKMFVRRRRHELVDHTNRIVAVGLRDMLVVYPLLSLCSLLFHPST